MGAFKNFLQEEDGSEEIPVNPEELLQSINDELAEMDEDEIYAFAYVLYYEFFEDEANTEDDYVDFDIEDVKAMIAEIGPEYYDVILDLLLPDEEEDGFDWDSVDIDDEEMDEAVSRVMKRKNFNRKKRRFFKKTKAELRKGLAKRRKQNRLTKTKKKRYFRANKVKIKLYKKSRSAAIKKGRHIKKVRRGA
jgi:hypothetical protein